MKGTRTGRTVSHLRDQKGYQDGLTSRRQSYKPFRRFAWLRIQLDFIKFLEASLVLGIGCLFQLITIYLRGVVV